jgi:lipopolysaccharide exporter
MITGDQPRDRVEPDAAPPGLSHRIVVGASWMILLRLADRGIGMVSVAVLARLLVPADFGIVALALSFVTIVETLGALGVESALIRDAAAGRTEYDAAWTIRLMVGLVLGLIMAAGAVPATSFLGDPRLRDIIFVLALSEMIGGLENIGPVEFQKRLDFRRDFLYRVGARIGSVMIGLTLAFLWRNYWALVIATLGRNLLQIALSYWVHPYRPRPRFSGWQPLIKFSLWLQVQSLIAALNSQLSNFIIARLMSVGELAYFTVGTEISRLVTTELQAPIRRAVFPGFALIANQLDRLRQGFIDTLGLLVLVGLPAASGVALLAPEIVTVLLGPKWLAAIPVVQITVLAGVIQSLRTGSQLVYLALNRPHLTTWLAATALAITVPAVVAGIHYDGVQGAAWALVLRAAVVLVADYVLLVRILALDPSRLVRVLWRSIAGAAIMAGAVWAVGDALGAMHSTSGTLVHLVIEAVTGAIVYVAAIAVLWRASGRPEGAETTALRVMRVALDRFARR